MQQITAGDQLKFRDLWAPTSMFVSSFFHVRNLKFPYSQGTGLIYEYVEVSINQNVFMLR
jgi:hypothetical protein